MNCGEKGGPDITPSRDGPYDQEFYDYHTRGSLASAKVVLGILFAHYQPQSIIDVGCGRGAWLKAAESLGCRELSGLDGDWVDTAQLLSDTMEFTPVDFAAAVPLPKRYDLCISLEVAEHLPPERAVDFVNLLCKASDVVLFSAAVEHQGGDNHLNEQWPSYWAQHFADNGYVCLDFLRSHIWGDEKVEWFYRQNILLYVRQDSASIDRQALKALERPIMDLVHPQNYAGKVRHQARLEKWMEQPTLRFCLQCLWRFVVLKSRRAWSRKGGR